MWNEDREGVAYETGQVKGMPESQPRGSAGLEARAQGAEGIS